MVQVMENVWVKAAAKKNGSRYKILEPIKSTRIFACVSLVYCSWLSG